MVKITVEYQGQLRCEAKHEPSGRTLETDAPVDNHGRGESFSPTDLVATALATCMATVMGIYAERHGIDLRGMRLEAGKEMSTDTPRRIARLSVEIWVPLPSTHPDCKPLETAALSCPVHHSLHPDVQKPVRFHYLEN
ncbi:MAG: OsmC family protein [Methylacidiphilales bacterium]|nr:OsmC family protein [Candidatus Methylacidiphilales bacterium]